MDFDSVARLASDTDNAGIATCFLSKDQIVAFKGNDLVLSHSVLEGHRFAVEAIPAGSLILSWGVGFGKAVRDIAPGEYLCNEMALKELRIRSIDFEIPEAPNFEDYIPKVDVRPEEMQASPELGLVETPGTFSGFIRGGGRGVGTRNFVGVLAVNSNASAFCRRLAREFKDTTDTLSQVDGVVPIDHTEGGERQPALNHELVIRTLAGFVKHPNLGAVLLVEPESGALTADDILGALPDEVKNHVTVAIVKLAGGYEDALKSGRETIQSWLPSLNEQVREEAPLRELKLALQCGGSDAFSGVSGNPLAGQVARMLLKNGGSANLAETTELIGGEAYVLSRVKSPDVAKDFLGMIDRYQKLASFHGHSAEGNPSGGNLFRGLYNIVIKSIGAAMKKDPEVRLDAVLEYGEAMTDPGYYFMDSAGNDLESIAGQVSSGCNVVHFVTGNGSITNFPFVPTIKLVTTTSRYELLSAEMDVNAGRYLDGESMESLTDEVFELTRSVASGEKVVGEKAGHSQVQLWRQWRQEKSCDVEAILSHKEPAGEGLHPELLKSYLPGDSMQLQQQLFPEGDFDHRVRLILPTSLCAGQIAGLIASGLSSEASRYVALPHTEGCGTARGHAEALFTRTLMGYLNHPLVSDALLLEHGCEKTHNDEFRHQMRDQGMDPDRFGWASIQADGGIAAVSAKVGKWFEERESIETNSGDLQLGVIAQGEISSDQQETLLQLVSVVIEGGGSVITPSSECGDKWLAALKTEFKPTLAFAKQPVSSGLHLMEMHSDSVDESITALGAGGCHVVIVVSEARQQGHPLFPVLLWNAGEGEKDWADIGKETRVDEVCKLVSNVLSGQGEPISTAHGDVHFQVTRGPLGISL